MRFKTSSKTLGKLMRSGETAAAHQNPHDDPKEKKPEEAAADVIIADQTQKRIKEELEQLEDDAFEKILKDVASSKTDLLKKVPSGVDPAIMGLIDNAKASDRLAEQEHDVALNAKAPVKFDEVVDFIDDGAEEILPPPQLFIKNIKVSTCGNPVVDLDGQMNKNKAQDTEEENYLKKMEQDPISRMEMGRSPVLPLSASAFSGMKQVPVGGDAKIEKAVDDVDMEKVLRGQRNVRCDEAEQIAFLRERGLREGLKYDSVLGPVSRSQFSAFANGLPVACELGVINPVSAANYSNFQTCTPNGRLLPAIPRKCFSANEQHGNSPKQRPTPQRAPVTMMLQTPIPNLKCHRDLHPPSARSSESSSSPPKTPPPVFNMKSVSQKKRERKKKAAEKKYAAAAAGENAEANEEEMNSSGGEEEENEKENEKEKEKEQEKEDDEAEKENNDEALTEKELEMRRMKNRKAKEKKARKALAKKEELKALDAVHEQIVQMQQTSGSGNKGNNNRKNQSQLPSEGRRLIRRRMSPPETSSSAVEAAPEESMHAVAAVEPIIAADDARDSPPPLPAPRRMRDVFGDDDPVETPFQRLMLSDSLGLTEKMEFCHIFGYHPFSIFALGASSQEESPKSNNVLPIRRNGGGKKRLDKNVNAEYTVPQRADMPYWIYASKLYNIPLTDGGIELERVLKELGVHDVKDLSDNVPKKKLKQLKKSETKQKKKKNNKNNKKKEEEEQPQQPSEEEEKPESPTSEPAADKESTSEEVTAKKQPKEEESKGKKMDESAVAASITKRCSSGAGQQSEEDDVLSYVSAQENLGGSNSRLSTPPAEFVDARQSRDEAENVMLDPNNYRTDENIDQLAKQLQAEENEFITVGKNKKKNKKESSSPPSNNRRNTNADTRPAAPSTAASSVSNFAVATPSTGTAQSNHQQQPHQQQQQHQRGAGRPVVHATTLADFMETTKKDTHKNIKHKKTGAAPQQHNQQQQQQKKQPPFEEPALPSPAFVDAVETPITVNTTPAFSYADAAKKTSGDNTPAQEMSPIPVDPSVASPAQSASNKKQPAAASPKTAVSTTAAAPSPAAATKPKEPVVETKKTSSSVAEPATPAAPSSSSPPPATFASAVTGGVQLPASTVAAAAADFSFGYEEPEDKRKRQQKKTKTGNSPPPKQTARMNGADFLASLSKTQENGKENDHPQMPIQAMSASVCEILATWQNRWDFFQTSGSKPVVFKPSNK